MAVYKVVRTYNVGDKAKQLQEAFDAGYTFVRASEYIPEGPHHYGYIEYILVREDK